MGCKDRLPNKMQSESRDTWLPSPQTAQSLTADSENPPGKCPSLSLPTLRSSVPNLETAVSLNSKKSSHMLCLLILSNTVICTLNLPPGSAYPSLSSSDTKRNSQRRRRTRQRVVKPSCKHHPQTQQPGFLSSDLGSSVTSVCDVDLTLCVSISLHGKW